MDLEGSGSARIAQNPGFYMEGMEKWKSILRVGGVLVEIRTKCLPKRRKESTEHLV
jgi:hypothetical protein